MITKCLWEYSAGILGSPWSRGKDRLESDHTFWTDGLPQNPALFLFATRIRSIERLQKGPMKKTDCPNAGPMGLYNDAWGSID